jgi:hypothetical protein
MDQSLATGGGGGGGVVVVVVVGVDVVVVGAGAADDGEMAAGDPDEPGTFTDFPVDAGVRADGVAPGDGVDWPEVAGVDDEVVVEVVVVDTVDELVLVVCAAVADAVFTGSPEDPLADGPGEERPAATAVPIKPPIRTTAAADAIAMCRRVRWRVPVAGLVGPSGSATGSVLWSPSLVAPKLLPNISPAISEAARVGGCSELGAVTANGIVAWPGRFSSGNSVSVSDAAGGTMVSSENSAVGVSRTSWRYAQLHVPLTQAAVSAASPHSVRRAVTASVCPSEGVEAAAAAPNSAPTTNASTAAS